MSCEGLGWSMGSCGCLLGSLRCPWGCLCVSLGCPCVSLGCLEGAVGVSWGGIRGSLGLEGVLGELGRVKNTVYPCLQVSLGISGEARGDLFFKVSGCSV